MCQIVHTPLGVASGKGLRPKIQNLRLSRRIIICNKIHIIVLFIDASKEFEKGKNQNNLKDEHIDKIVNTFKERKDIDKYAHVASIEEIRENDLNLNIPRYVDTFEEEEPVNLDEINKQLEQDNKEIAELEAEINEQLKILGVK